MPFDEGRLWKGEDGEELKRQLQAHFHNITKAMDCVGCEKCKLWGKLQILGALLLLSSLCICGLLSRHGDVCTARQPICFLAPELTIGFCCSGAFSLQ